MPWISRVLLSHVRRARLSRQNTSRRREPKSRTCLSFSASANQGICDCAIGTARLLGCWAAKALLRAGHWCCPGEGKNAGRVPVCDLVRMQWHASERVLKCFLHPWALVRHGSSTADFIHPTAPLSNLSPLGQEIIAH